MKAMGNNAAVCSYDRLVSEVPGMGTEAVEVPAQRSGAACPTGAVTAGDWGWTDRISSRNP